MADRRNQQTADVQYKYIKLDTMNKYFKITNKSFDEMGVKTYEELWQKVAKDHEGLSADVNTIIKKEGDNKFHAVFSSALEDRHGDIVHQNFDLKWFKKNPVFLDSHNYGTIAAIIGKINNIRVKDEILQGDIEFALDNPVGLLAMKLSEGGFLNTTSIGFIPKQFGQDGSIEKSELLEISAVSVPANPQALIEKAMEIIDEEVDGVIEEVADEAIVPEASAVKASRAKARKEALLAVLSQIKAERDMELAQALQAVKRVSKIKEKSNNRRRALKALRAILENKPK